MKNIKRLQRAIDFIEDNLDENIAIASAAQAAAFSHWHFQTVFHAVTGDTVKVYLRKRRLTRAGIALCSSQIQIIDIALIAGFESQQSFSRAFKTQFGITPAVCRKQDIKSIMINSKPKITEEYLRHLSIGINMQPVIKTLDSILAIGMETHFISAAAPRFNALEVIPRLWGDFRARKSEISNLAGEYNVGVTFPKWEGQKSNLENMLYVACAAVTSDISPPKGMVRIEIPAGRYAIFTHKGKVEGIAHTMRYIYGSWLPKSEHQLRDAPHLELYDHRFIYNENRSECDIAIPIA